MDFPLLPRDLVGFQTLHPQLQALRVRLSTSVGSWVSGQQLAAQTTYTTCTTLTTDITVYSISDANPSTHLSHSSQEIGHPLLSS